MPRRKTCHSPTVRGVKVLVRLKDGTKFVDRFVEAKSGVIIFEEHGRVAKADIDSMPQYTVAMGEFKDA